jgi:hypothetical protein
MFELRHTLDAHDGSVIDLMQLKGGCVWCTCAPFGDDSQQTHGGVAQGSEGSEA